MLFGQNYKLICQMSSIFNMFKKDQKPKKDIKQEEILSQTRSALIRSCRVCNAQTAQKVVYGQDVEAGLTCKRCELKAVNNEPTKLVTNLVAVDKFSQALAKQIKVYHTEKSNPNNIIKLNTMQASEGVKNAEVQIGQIKEAYKQLHQRTQQKLHQLGVISLSCNKVPVFENVNKLVTDKKLQSIGNGQVIVKDAIVTDSLHFLNKNEIEEDNKRNQKRVEQTISTSEVNLDTLNELITHIDKLLV